MKNDPNEIKKFKHRDLNWLSFNERVLQEAEDKNNPVYERLKFLAIFSSNLDEYYRVRVSQLRQMKHVDKRLRKKLALKPSKLVKQIIEEIKKQQVHFGKIFYNEIIPELAQNNINLIDENQFDTNQKEFAKKYFEKHIKNQLSPKIIHFIGKDTTFLENGAVYFLVEFEEDQACGLLNLPTLEERFVVFPSGNNSYSISFVDAILRAQIEFIFPENKIIGVYEIKMSRDAELYLDDEMEGSLAEKIYHSLSQRQKGQATRLLYDAAMPKAVVKKLRKHLGLGKIDMMPGGEYHNFHDFFSFPDPTGKKELHFKDLPPIPHKTFENSTNYFKTIFQKDQLIHFPFMSFNYVENLVEQAASDDKTTAIKISFYRIAENSRLTNFLLKALDNGKELTVFIEAKARFDEENNIDWGRKFEKKGANVIYSYPKIKVHCKILLIQRKENRETVNYAYIGTGNFNSSTSKVYCDHGLFTAHKKIGKELDRVFQVLEGKLIIPRTTNLLVSPFNTRRVFLNMIQREIDFTKEGKEGKISAKMNSLEDREIIESLYKASNFGVKIRLLVRGFTCLIPGVKNLSKNISMTSILDRYLEHGRIYLFHNGGDEQLYIGSADWMTRNLDRRIEVLAPIYDKTVATELKDILTIQLNDNVKARVQDAEESNHYVKSGQEKIRSQHKIYIYLKEKNM